MRPLILITNDDGVFSPGLAAAAAAVQDFGDLLVVAPRYQQTTMGRSFPRLEETGRIEKVAIKVNGLEIPAFGVHGSPAQAVAHGILELADRKPDLCISGINYGANIGLSLTCSGTLGAAFEADSHGIKAVAISLQTPLHWQKSADYPDTDWTASQDCLSVIIKKVLTDGLPNGAIILNINVPDQPVRPLKVLWTRQSRFNDSIFVKPGPRDMERKYLLESVLNPDCSMVAKQSDAYALHVEKAVSVTPLSWDMTACSLAEDPGTFQLSEGGLT